MKNEKIIDLEVRSTISNHRQMVEHKMLLYSMQAGMMVEGTAVMEEVVVTEDIVMTEGVEVDLVMVTEVGLAEVEDLEVMGEGEEDSVVVMAAEGVVVGAMEVEEVAAVEVVEEMEEGVVAVVGEVAAVR